MPSRPISQDTIVDLEDQLYFPAIDLTISGAANQNVRVSGAWFTAALNNPIVYSFSGIPEASVSITYVAQCNLRVAADVAWFSYCGAPPDDPATFVATKVLSDVLTTIGDVVVGTDG